VFFHPNMSVRAHVGAMQLLTLPVELKIQEIIKAHGGALVCGGLGRIAALYHPSSTNFAPYFTKILRTSNRLYF
jgi:hypothetical protein